MRYPSYDNLVDLRHLLMGLNQRLEDRYYTELHLAIAKGTKDIVFLCYEGAPICEVDREIALELVAAKTPFAYVEMRKMQHALARW